MRKKNNVSAIRFLPMGANIFQDKDEVLQFLGNDLHKQQGYYYYIKRNIVLDGSTLVLFQFQGELIASAIMIDQDDKPLESNGISYNGRYHFDIESIVIFEEPITAEEYQAIDTGFTGFNQSTRATDIKYLDEIMQLIDNKKRKVANYQLNKSKLDDFCNAYILYEIATHGEDPRTTLEGTDLRLHKGEGYKYGIYSESKAVLNSKGEYVEKILNLLKTTKQNLVDYHQITKLSHLAEGEQRSALEAALIALYDGEDDKIAFDMLTDVVGGSFDVLGFLFFLKDNKKYLPIRSSLFDERFGMLGVDVKLSGNCSYDKYIEFLNLIKNVQAFLQKYLNKDITLLDAHSFLWILPYLKKYLNEKMQLVVHKKFGQGVIIGTDGESITVEFGGSQKTFVSSVIEDGILTILPLERNIYLKEETEEKLSSGESYAVLNEPRIKTVQEWELILKHEKKHNKGFNFVERVLLEMYKRDDYAIFCRSFEKEIGYKGLNLRVGDFRNRIKKINGVNLEEQIRKDTNTDRAWNIPFETDEWLNKNSSSGSFCWVLRRELIKAIENVYPGIKQERKDYVKQKEMEYSLDLKEKPVLYVESAEYMKATHQPIQKSGLERKFFPPKADYALKQFRNKAVGDAGEQKVVHEEKATLKMSGREDLAEQVHIVPSDAYGYDVMSYYPDGGEKHIEVKTSTSASDDVMFHITANEVNTILNDSAYVLHYLYATKEDKVKIVAFSNQDLRDEIIKKYMTPTQFVVRMKKQ